MTKPDEAWLSVLSELLVNLAAGWFGAAFIAPNFIASRADYKPLILLADITLGIVCLLIAHRLRKRTIEL